jgi:hypothetical protein
MQMEAGAPMQASKIGYFVMGVSAAVLFQSFFRRRAAAAGQSQVADAKGGNVIDLVAWRRDMPNWR